MIDLRAYQLPHYQGTSDVQLDAQGQLVVTLPAPANTLADTVVLSSTLTEQAPVAEERDIAVPVRFVIESSGEVGFALGAYDPTLPLIIDPTLTYSTYLGGSGNDSGEDSAVDSAGNAYVTGFTWSINFPMGGANFDPSANGNSDVFVAKLNPSGNALVYSTYLGGSNIEWGLGIAVDSSGYAYLAGATYSSNFPNTFSYDFTCGGCPTDPDAFVAKLNASGDMLLYSTFLGGANYDRAEDIAIDGAGNAYVTGYTLVADLAAYVDHFLSAFNRKDQASWAHRYLLGLLSEHPRKSIEPIALAHGFPIRSLQAFTRAGAAGGDQRHP